MSKYSPPPLPLLTGLFNEHLITSKIKESEQLLSTGQCPVAQIPSPPPPPGWPAENRGGGGAEWWEGVQLVWGADLRFEPSVHLTHTHEIIRLGGGGGGQ